MPEDHRENPKPLMAHKKRKSPDVDDGSPTDQRHDVSNNNVGTCQSGAVLGVPVKNMQQVGMEQSPEQDCVPLRGKSLNDGAESSKPAYDGENRARLVWSQELHNRFLNALSHLGLKLAVPKSILGLMEVDGMTRENIASHLQKYRLFLKKMGGFTSKDKVSVERLQELHEENIRRMATQEAMQEAALSVDESDSNAAAVDQPQLRNVVEGIPITGSMSIRMEPNALKLEKELLDPRNLQYPAVGLVPSLGQVVHDGGHQSHEREHHHNGENLRLEGFGFKAVNVSGIADGPEEELCVKDHEPLLHSDDDQEKEMTR